MQFFFTKIAKKQWKKFSPDIRDFLKMKINEYKLKPELFEQNLKKVVNLEPADFRLKISNYRFLLKTDFDENIHTVLKCGHRRDIYK